MFAPRTDNNRAGATPADQGAITNATYKMVGLGLVGWTLTPLVTGRVLIGMSGDWIAGAAATTATAQLSFGTGTAPSNAGTLAGTQQGGQLSWVTLASQLTIPFSMSAVITGLTVGTAAWFDLCIKNTSPTTLQVTNANVWAIEI